MNPQDRFFRALVTGTLSALLAGLTGCVTTSSEMAPESGKTVIDTAASLKSESAPSEHREKPAGWVLVADNPPTFFPAGLSEEANTDYRHGEWVMAGELGSKWFIPRGGIGGRSEESLRAEAISMVTNAEKAAVGLENAGDFVGKSMWTSLLLAAATGAAMGGCQPDGLGDALNTIWAH